MFNHAQMSKLQTYVLSVKIYVRKYLIGVSKLLVSYFVERNIWEILNC
jgi:hypothetical protein